MIANLLSLYIQTLTEGILEWDDSFPTEMAGIWSIDKVTAKGDCCGGYRCAVMATLTDQSV
ncbi:hypothetical protein [Shewanella surugensis]|uniref:Uncharacterized protein n=1 Tax=Shewanella surugensis TaxID=212020 RepID=A0ABT0LC13_9GAMM|nr:hypothetical protein [Shewanella surugensis]MCL1125203.1 hypothetical protein [Shewanella surugensis]